MTSQPIATLLSMSLCAGMSMEAALAEIEGTVEITVPFRKSFQTEQMDFFVRISNTGDTQFRAASTAQHDLFFETEPGIRKPDGDLLNLPSVANRQSNEPQGVLLDPGQAYVLSDADYNEAELVNSECFVRFRVHAVVEPGKWFSSQWIERDILPDPALTVSSLYDYVLSDGSNARHSVIPLSVDGEVWLFSHVAGSDRVGRRLCRVPAGSQVTAITHDTDARRLTVKWSDEPDPVVINTRSGLPISGPQSHVPHLYLWKQIAGRPFTDSWQEMWESQRGESREKAIRLTTVPIARDAKTQADQGRAPSAGESPSQTNAGDHVTERVTIIIVIVAALFLLCLHLWKHA